MNIQKALVIDDSKVAHLTLRKLLTEQGIDVDWVGSGEDGIAYLKRQRPDVVFMDIMMPGMDGFETIGAINQDSAIVAPPIVMCSANATDEDRHNAKQNGAIAFLSKPYTADELNQSLDQVRALAAPTAARPHPAAVEQAAVSTSTESRVIEKAAEVARAMAEQVIRSALQKTGRAIQEALKDTAIKAARTTAEEAARVVAERVAREVSEGVAARAISTLSQDGARRDLDEIREGLAKELEVQLSRGVQEALAHAMAGGEFRQRLSTLVEPTARQAAAQTAREVAIQALAEAAPPKASEIAGQAASKHAKLALAAGFAAVIISVVMGVLF